jgi:hypothetical protein
VIREFTVSEPYPDGTVRLVVVADRYNIADLVRQIVGRMVDAEPSEQDATPEPEPTTFGALRVADLDALPEASTVWAHRVGGIGTRRATWRKQRSGRWVQDLGVRISAPGVTADWLVHNRGPVIYDGPPAESATD